MSSVTEIDPSKILGTQEILVSEILVEDEWNCRSKITPLDVAQLSQDIKEHGLINPIFVAILENDSKFKYKLVAGFRRLYAHKVLGKETVRATVSQETDEIKLRAINLRENLVRQDLSIAEEARALQPLLARLPEEKVAEELGLTRGFVQIRKMFLEMPEPVREEVDRGNLTQTHLRELYSYKHQAERENKPSEPIVLAKAREMKECKQKGLMRIPKATSRGRSAKRQRRRPEIFAMQTHLRRMFGSCLGTLVLGWVSGELSDAELNEDLEKICERAKKPFIEWNPESLELNT